MNSLLEPADRVHLDTRYTIKNTASKDGLINVYRAIMRTKNISYTKVKSGRFRNLIIDRAIWAAIKKFEELDGFAGMTLSKYLDTMFTREPENE